MNFEQIEATGITIAIVKAEGYVITDIQSALDLVANASYVTGSDRIIIEKSQVSESFFDLKTKLAGEVLQKFINYKVKVAIVGDFSMYSSKSLKDFMFECNKGKDIFFVSTEQEAIERLSK